MTAAFKGRIALSAFLVLTLAACSLPSPGVTKASPSTPALVIASPTPPPITPPTNLVRPGTVTFLSDTTYPPQDSMDTNNQAIGFDIDIAQALATKMALTATIQKTDSPLLVGALLAKKGDAIISAMQITPDQLKQAGSPFKLNAEGIAIDPKNGELLTAMQQAMMAIYQDGTYRQILTKWNLLDGEIPASQIVVTPSPSTS